MVPGLTYNAATQLLTGRPTIAASVSMTYTVTDSDANTDTTDEETLTFTIEVKNSPSEFLPGSQVSDKLFLVGRGITPVVFPAASGGEGEITYSLVPPVPGLILDGAARRWEGTPTEEVDYMVSLVAEDADGARAAIQFHVVVKLNKSEPTFGDVKSVAWEIGESQGPYAPVGSTPVVTAVADNRLIYSLAGDDAASFRVRGDGQVEVGPGTRLDYEVRETYSFVLEVRDGLDAFGVGDDVIDDWLTVTVTVSDEDEDVFGVRFGSDGSPSGVRDQDYLVGQRIIPIQLPGAQGGAGNLTYTLSPLPPGLSFDARALLLTGTPSQEWDQDATLTAKDGRGALGRVYFGIRVTPRAERPEFGDWAWISDQVYVLNRDIEPLELPRASGGNEPLEYTLEPRVPGLYFDGANLQLSGVPGQASAYAMRYQVVDRDGDRKVLEFQVRVVSEEQLALIVGPGMPTELSASTVGENTDPVVVVSWRAPGVVGSAPVTHYDVERSANGLVWQEIARVEAVPGRTELIYSDDEVVRGEEWSYRVMAVNDMSAGLSSEMVSVVVGSESRVTGGLQPPGGLDYLVNEALVRIFWTNSGSGNAYQLDVWYAGQNDWVSHANGGTMNEWAVELSCCDDDDPVPEWARVRTVQVHGPQDQSESAWSDSLRIYTEEQVIGEVLAPTGLEAVMDHGLIQLWWADVTNMSGYQVEMRDTEGSDAQWRGVDHGTAGLVRTNRTLVACCYEEEFYGYQFRVRSVLLSRDGRANYSDWSLPLGLPIDRRPALAETVVEPTAAAPVETEIVAQVPPNDEFTPIIEAGQMGGPGFVANEGVSFLGMEVKGFAGFLVLALAAAIGGVSVLIYVRRRGEAALEEGLELAPRSDLRYFDDEDDDGSAAPYFVDESENRNR